MAYIERLNREASAWERIRLEPAARRNGRSAGASPGALCAVGCALIAAGRFDEAAEQLRGAVRQHPGEPLLSLALAGALEQGHDYDAALDELARLAELAPDLLAVHLAGTRVALAARRIDRAMVFAALAAQLAPDEPAARTALRQAEAGAAFEANRKGDHKLAEALLRAHVGEAAATAAVLRTYGWALIGLGRFADASRHLSSALEHFPDEPYTRLARATALEKEERWDEAMLDLRHLLTLIPRAYAVHVAASRVSLALRQKDDAVRYAFQAVEIAPDSETAVACLVKAASASGRHKLAALAARSLSLIKPSDARVHLRLAQMLEHAKEYREAIEAAFRALELAGSDAPTRHSALGTAAWSAVKLGDRKLAAQLSDRLASDGPQLQAPSAVMHGLFSLHRMADRFDRAAPFTEHLRASRRQTTARTTLAKAIRGIEPQSKPNADLGRWQVAWDLADKHAWSQDDWQRAVLWGAEAHQLVTAWCDGPAECRGQLDALTDAPSLDAILSQTDKSRQPVFVMSHFGPFTAIPRALEARGVPGRLLQASFIARQNENRTIFAYDANAPREVIQELRRGNGLIAVPDNSMMPDRNEFALGGRRIELSILVPKLAYRLRVPIVWLKAAWTDDRRIVIEAAPGSVADQGETEAEFTRRWGQVYLELISAQMRGDPRNLNLWQNFGTVWTYFDH
ncbi:MAG: tetratricopeptide repeat protein [Hyphomicrobiaceae bacterium]